MNLAFSNNQDQIIDENRSTSQTEFYWSKHLQAAANYLKNECTIPVFSKDSECTISHYELLIAPKKLFDPERVLKPDIRVSHVNQRISTAIGKLKRAPRAWKDRWHERNGVRYWSAWN
jgi:hypothetical protein